MPSTEAMLMTLAGRSCEAAARSGFASAVGRKNSDLTLRSITLSQPLSGNSSNSAPQAAPALLTGISSFGSSLIISEANFSQPATVEMSSGSGMQSPAYAEVGS